jgi:DNA invertase Pin-like site-specific DNA recombinase
MDKITKEHLYKKAFVYIRQSTMEQVENNLESQRIQYGLRERAIHLGWVDVEVIDDDLGRSGSGNVRWDGFERLCHHVCIGEVGAIFCIEASRLARNGREWHTLIELCAIVHTLIIDHDGIYDPRVLNDRLLLGMKGTFSEMELSLFRQRSQMALREKSMRGDLFTTVPVGYQRVGKDGLEKDPDRRVVEAILLVFKKFRELGSARQTLLWFRQEGVELPRLEYGTEGWKMVWRLPIYGMILKILTNPIYAGAYAYGRTQSRISIEGGRKRVTRGHRKEMKDWEVLILGHHAGYISWEEFQFNQETLTQNANQKGLMVRRAVNRGTALLAGLLRCGHCGRKLHVGYSGTTGNVIRYYCRGAHINHGSNRCISFGGLRVDQVISTTVLEVLTPLGIKAAIMAAANRGREQMELIRHKELSLQQAEYEATRSGRQYNAVEPENRLVASELERRWNEALAKVETIKAELRVMKEITPMMLSSEEEARIYELGQNISTLWNHPSGDVGIKKRILRILLIEIIVKVNPSSGIIHLILHWQGGDHTQIFVTKNRYGHHRYRTDIDTIELIRGLARCLPDKMIASQLNRMGRKTGKGHTWTESSVRTTRSYHKIPVYVEGERQNRGEMTMDKAASLLKISQSSMRRLILRRIIPAKQLCPGAPWIIKKTDLEKQEVQQWALMLRKGRIVIPQPESCGLLFQ